MSISPSIFVQSVEITDIKSYFRIQSVIFRLIQCREIFLTRIAWPIELNLTCEC
jgi:hypothetical protein